MSFGKRGLVQNGQAAVQADFGAAAPNRHGAAVGADDYVLKYGVKDALAGVLGMTLFGWFLEPAISGGSMTGKAMFLSAIAALCFLGCAFLFVVGVLRKTKFTADATGLAHGTLTGESRLAWQDIEGFEILTVNYNKSVFVKAKKTSMLSMAKKVRIPVGAFKSRDYELLKWTSAYRPDLTPQILAVMSKVGAKRLVKELAQGNTAAQA